ncbi:metal-dependent hydrolase family protein [Marinobacter arenosus]|uniref:metal-dependent hydrolase family protein n=1 Tax=Marinobacter arenosus TaxID=2856822 RepID=UPI001C4B748E|nr:amidohydrolase family protein [Marinobacter arenosus]MBW0146227.1 amidohydrolase family protein [Marinobacter arenosus]
MELICRTLKITILLFAALSSLAVVAQPLDDADSKVLFTNVNVFDGQNDELIENVNVLVEGNLITSISSSPIDATDAETIAGNGKTLMPGLIDAHAHITFNNLPKAQLLSVSQNYMQIRAAAYADDFLMTGFTSVRDLAGNTFGLKKAIDEGLIVGPRIWPSGAMISQTSGHGDFRGLNDLPGAALDDAPWFTRAGLGIVADGVAEVRRAVREQLMQGASQVKLAAGGGVSSDYDPIDVTEYSEAELAAAVGAAEDWGTYVAVHAYTPRAIKRAIEAGVKCIDHGQLLDEDTLKLMAKRGVWFSSQPFLEDEDAIPTAPGSANELKYKQVAAGTAETYRLAKKHGVKIAFGLDMQFNPDGIVRQAYYLPKMTNWFTPAETLKMATHDNAELLAMSGPRNPYQGKLGVVEEGALADLLLVDGNPLTNIKLLENPSKNFLVIMKDGKVYKNTVM